MEQQIALNENEVRIAFNNLKKTAADHHSNNINGEAPLQPHKVIILAGPGGGAWGGSYIQHLATSMRSAGADVTMIGDGERPVYDDEVAKTFEALSKTLSSGPLTLFIDAHGDVEHGKHTVSLDDYRGTFTAKIFNMAARYFNEQTVDIFMASCHGGAAISDVDKLPKGSALAVLASSKDVVYVSEIEKLVQGISSGIFSGNFSARHLMNIYLEKTFTNRVTPSVATSGQTASKLPAPPRTGRENSTNINPRSFAKNNK